MLLKQYQQKSRTQHWQVKVKAARSVALTGKHLAFLSFLPFSGSAPRHSSSTTISFNICYGAILVSDPKVPRPQRKAPRHTALELTCVALASGGRESLWTRPRTDRSLCSMLSTMSCKPATRHDTYDSINPNSISLESFIGREASTATSPLHPTNQRCWFHASYESALSAGRSCCLSPYEAL